MEQSAVVPSNREIEDFVNRNRRYVENACRKAGLCESEWDDVLQKIRGKFANGELKFDATRGARESTYVYRVAWNAADDERRRGHYDRYDDWDDKAVELIADARSGFGGLEREDERLVLTEALNRLAERCEEKKVEILVRRVFHEEGREVLAREYGETPDYISCVVTRWLPRLKEHVSDVWREDE